MRQTVERLRRWLRTIGIVRRSYRKFVERRLHLSFPRRFTEKMQWRKLFDLDPIYTVFCDKIATREYVARRLGSNAVVPILWLGHDPSALPLETLQPPYIIKCSHGSGFNITVRSKDDLNYAAIRAQFAGWLSTDYSDLAKEPGYAAVPRRLLIEPLLTDNGGFPAEYMFFMFSGIARVVMVKANYGDQKHERTQTYYDLEWRRLPIRTLEVQCDATPVPRPRELETMRIMAERLAENCDHIRVDFIVGNGRVYVGELSSYHKSGFFRFERDEHDLMLGQWWELRRPLLRACWTVITRDWNIASKPSFRR
jgi:TupA-like ATPgrasp